MGRQLLDLLGQGVEGRLELRLEHHLLLLLQVVQLLLVSKFFLEELSSLQDCLLVLLVGVQQLVVLLHRLQLGQLDVVSKLVLVASESHIR